MPQNPEDRGYWSHIKKALAVNTQYSLKMAMIETNAIFLNYLKSKNIRVNSSKDAIRILSSKLSSTENLRKAINCYENIMEGKSLDMFYKETKNHIGSYYQAMVDIKDLNAFEVIMNRGYQILYRFSRYLYNKFIYIILGFLAFFAMVVILNDTFFGESLVDFIVLVSHKILFSIIPAFAVIVLIMLFTVGYYLFTRRKKAYNNTKIIFDEDFEE